MHYLLINNDWLMLRCSICTYMLYAHLMCSQKLATINDATIRWIHLLLEKECNSLSLEDITKFSWKAWVHNAVSLFGETCSSMTFQNSFFVNQILICMACDFYTDHIQYKNGWYCCACIHMQIPVISLTLKGTVSD